MKLLLIDATADTSSRDYFDAHQLSIPVGWWLSTEDREQVAAAVISFATADVVAYA